MKAPCDPRPQRPRTKAGVKTTANRTERRNTRWSDESCLRQGTKSGRQLAGRGLGLMHLRRCWLRNENARRQEPSGARAFSVNFSATYCPVGHRTLAADPRSRAWLTLSDRAVATVFGSQRPIAACVGCRTDHVGTDSQPPDRSMFKGG